MAVQEQVFGFFIPTVTLMGVGAYKEIGKQIRTLGGTKPFICTDQGIVDSGILDQKDQDLKIMAENAQKDACGLTNPRCPNLDDVIQIYRNAL